MPTSRTGRIRLGLCCTFLNEPIKFRTTTATALLKLPRRDALAKVAGVCMENAETLFRALAFCRDNGIGSFRINSQVLPVKTHPEAGYSVDELPRGRAIRERFRDCGRFAAEHGIRTTFHPDQFIVLSSEDDALTARSVKELEYQAQVAEWVGADVINLHGGGAYGDKESALARVEANIRKLPKRIKRRLTLENDDRAYTPEDLLPLCKRAGIPMVYDVHHHRCLQDGLSVAEVTRQVLDTWDREPVFHLSSPKQGWRGPAPTRHHDYVNHRDFPGEWKKLRVTIEVEAKAKELAVKRLRRYLSNSGVTVWPKRKGN